MKADRLLSIVLLLQARGRLTGRQLAGELEVSARTVHRDMEALSAAGVPVFALRGALGGWQLEEGWRMQVPGLDASELRALLMAQPRVVGDGGLAVAAERALGKLLASLPHALREQAASMRQRLHVDTSGWRGATENLAMLPVVQDAVSRDRKLAFRYWRAGREAVERAVDPLGLVAKGSAWYLVARTPDGMRTYRVSRMDHVRLLDTPSERPAGFDLGDYWRTSWRRFEETLPSYPATLCLEPRAARWVQMSRPASAVAVEGTGADGWVTLRVQFDYEEEAAFYALGLGPRCRVLAPDALRDRVVAEAAEVAARARRP
jgi:predicted DNA-binding transcriptional regulator YafY